MAELHDIRCGLAALLRTALPSADGHVGPYFEAAPPGPWSVTVAGVERMERTTFGGPDHPAGRDYTIQIEGVFSLQEEIGSQKLLDSLIADSAIDEAVESDGNSSGALYSRLDENGDLTEDQAPACDAVAFLEYRGAARHTLKDGRDVLLATWAVQVLT